MKSIRTFILGFLLWFIIAGTAYYVFLPAFNIHSIGLYMYLVFCCLLPAFLIFLSVYLTAKTSKFKDRFRKLTTGSIVVAVVIFILVLFIIFLNSSIFNAKKYASVLNVEDYDFSQDIDQANALSKIALMDTNSARILGSREIGSLSSVVSQYEVSDDYSQIDLNGSPYKVSALEYAGFFKYMSNKSKGIPGYVKVDPVSHKADYVTLSKGMVYVPSSYFQKDLARHLRFQYPTMIFENLHFEVDEEGNPYYIASIVDYTVGLFGAKTISGVLICNPVTGDCTRYQTGDVPQWVDMVFDGDLLTQHYDWYGQLSGGYLNSIMAKKGCKKCTETNLSATDDEDSSDTYVPDYGYIAKDGDIWIYTGVTSVNKDSSNIGFIMINERTSEAHFFSIAGADENSAMASAEGEVQEKRYEASFPSLINVDNNPTYVMVLKDSNGLVKLYAMVNVEQYNIVATADTIEDCFTVYRKKLSGGDTQEEITEPSDQTQTDPDASVQEDPALSYDEKDIIEKSIEIDSIQYVDINGNTYVYLTDKTGIIYKQKFAENEKLILLKNGDSVTVSCVPDGDGIYYILSLK